MIELRAHARFWEFLDDLPEEVRNQAARAYELMEHDPFHPSIHLNEIR